MKQHVLKELEQIYYKFAENNFASANTDQQTRNTDVLIQARGHEEQKYLDAYNNLKDDIMKAVDNMVDPYDINTPERNSSPTSINKIINSDSVRLTLFPPNAKKAANCNNFKEFYADKGTNDTYKDPDLPNCKLGGSIKDTIEPQNPTEQRYRDTISLSNPNSGIERASSATTQPPNSSSPASDGEDTDEGGVSIHVIQSLSAESDTRRDRWLWDTGADMHTVNDTKWFYNGRWKPLDREFPITTGGGIVHPTAIGQARVQILVEGKPVDVELKAALLIETFPLNIFSGERTYRNGGYVIRNDIFDAHNRKIARLNIPARGFLLEVKGSPQSKAGPMAMSASSHVEDARLWHRRLAHTSYENVARTAKCTKGMGDVKQPQIDPCDTCELAKSVRFTPKTVQPQSDRALNRVHIDLCFFKPLTSSKMQYLCLMTDDKSRLKKGGTLSTKDGASPFVRTTITQWHLQTGKYPVVLRRDAGGEFRDYPIREFARNTGIRYETTPPRGHEQAGFHERANRIILEKGRAIMVNNPDIPSELWGEVLLSAIDIANVTATKIRVDNKDVWMTPHEAFWNDLKPGDNKPDVSHLRAIGTKCFINIEPEDRVISDKLTPRAWEGILIGFDGRFIYKVYNPATKRIHRTSHVVFHEQSGHEHGDKIKRSRPEGAFRRKKDDFTLGMATQSHEFPDPPTLDAALKQPDGKLWWDATIDELINLFEKDAIRFVNKAELPKGYRLLTTKWVTRYKRDEYGQIIKRKMRLVARGFQQKEGIDFDETFSSTVRPASWRIIICISVQEEKDLSQADVVAAYLNSSLDKLIYVKQFPMLAEFMKSPRGKAWAEKLGWFEDAVILLNKALYGLKQSGRQWQLKFNKEMGDIGFKQLKTDTSVYIRKEKDQVVATYVDDVLSLTDSKKRTDELHDSMENTLELKKGGFPSHFLGVAIRKTDTGISISQGAYVDDILATTGLEACRPVGMPMDAGSYPIAKTSSEPTDNKVYAPFARFIGKTNYLATQTRPDIAFANGLWARFVANPTADHFARAKRIAQYLHGCRDLGIHYDKLTEKQFGNSYGIHGYTDSDYAGDPDTGRSTAGYVFFMCGGPISWASRKQKTIAKSTTEAEYYALSMATCEAIWIRGFMEELGRPIEGPITIFCDNQSAIKLAHNAEFHARTKQIRVEYHHIREAITEGQIKVEYAATDKMAADGLTKPLAKPQHEKFISLLNMKRCKLDDPRRIHQLEGEC
ncbi:Uncharacterized protein LW94_13101 [Fusarium fujikuroi]|nr:Uncharacterized protein LW94_13101 [Fusarium fujikuroi]